MGEAFFYHLTQDPVEVTLPVLLGKAREAGWRVALRGRDEGRLDWFDRRLWTDRDDGFLPHGRAGGPHDADQPILLTTGALANDPACLVSVDGAEVAVDEVTAMERVMILFDGNDPDAVEVARGQWRALTGAGCKAKYWSQDGGRWAMKAESKG